MGAALLTAAFAPTGRVGAVVFLGDVAALLTAAFAAIVLFVGAAFDRGAIVVTLVAAAFAPARLSFLDNCFCSS